VADAGGSLEERGFGGGWLQRAGGGRASKGGLGVCAKGRRVLLLPRACSRHLD
jgi:hypothetical protein